MYKKLTNQDFSDHPMYTTGKYGIKPLNDGGVEHDLGSEYFNYHFLSKVDPDIVKECLDEISQKKNVDKKVKRVKPYGFIKKIVLRLEEGCNWAGRREGKNKEDKDGRDNEEIFSQGCFLDERDVLRFDKEGVPLE